MVTNDDDVIRLSKKIDAIVKHLGINFGRRIHRLGTNDYDFYVIEKTPPAPEKSVSVDSILDDLEASHKWLYITQHAEGVLYAVNFIRERLGASCVNTACAFCREGKCWNQICDKRMVKA